MRARNIKPGFFENEILGTLDPITHLLFAGLFMLADRDGRLEDRPLRIKALIFPYRESLDIHRELTVLEQNGFIHRYKVDDLGYIQVVNFLKHQSPHHTEKKSVIPPPVSSLLKHGEYPPDSLIPDSLIPKKSDTRENGKMYHFDEPPIHLTEGDYRKWESEFYTIIDLKAELRSIARRFNSDPPKGFRPEKAFCTASAWLNSKHQRNLLANPERKRKERPTRSIMDDMEF